MRAHLIRLTIPMIWGILSMMSLNLVDTWFVAQLGKEQLAAMSFAFPVVMVLISLGIGFMAGTSSVIARVIGKGDWDRVRCLTTDALTLSTLCAIVLSVIGLLTMDPLFRLLGAEEALLPLIREYMVIWYTGYIVFLVPMAGVGAIRATGDAKLQSYIMLVAALVNLILDPLLIFGLLGFPAMGMAGAALATVVARTVSLVLGGYVLHRMKGMIDTSRRPLAAMLESWRSVMHVGLPAASTNMIIPLATGVVVAMIAEYGAEAVAGHGAASRIEAMALVVFFAMSSVIGPFVGQNLGAGRYDRIREAQIESARFCLVIGLAMGIVVMLVARPMLSMFSDDIAVLDYGQLFLLIVPLSFGPAGIIMVANAAFNGLGRPGPAVMISTTRMFLIMVPVAWIGGRWFGVGGIFFGIATANVVAAILAYVWHRRTLLLLHSSHSDQKVVRE